MNPRTDALDSHWESRGALDGYLAPVMHSGAPDWFNQAAALVQHRAMATVLGELSVHSPVVELGCGTGRWLKEMMSRRVDCIGVDGAESMLGKAGLRGQFKLVRADLKRIPLRDGSLGAVLSVTALQHMPPHAQLAALAGARRVVRDGGMLYMLERIGHSASPTLFPRTPSDWINLGSGAGWHLREWRGVEFWPLVHGLATVAAHLRRNESRELPPVRLASKQSLLNRAYWAAIRAALIPSVVLEPILRRTLPRGAATHGLFIFHAT